jgi:hypothetical protein
MAAPRSGTRLFSPRVVLCLALIGAGSMLYYHQGLFIPRAEAVRAAEGLSNRYSFGNDFYQVWLTSREWLAHGRDPYSPEMTRELQTNLYGRPLDASRPDEPADLRVFPYPAYVDVLLWPAGEFPFAAVRVGVVCVLAALTLASVLLWLRALDFHLSRKWLAVVLLLTLCGYPALEGLYAGQLGLLVAFLLAAAIVALQRHRLLLAGILMALTTIKPHVALLVILYLLVWSLHDWRARGRFYMGFFSTLILLVGTSLAVLPHWIQSWIQTVLAYRRYNPPPLLTEILSSLLGRRLASPATIVLTIALLIAAVALAWRNRAAAAASFAFALTVSLLLVITAIAILPGQAVYDHVILLPGILLLVRYRRELCDAGRIPRALVAIGALVLFWAWIAALAVIVVRPWLAPASFNSAAVLALPIRTAASLPFAVLALLAWTTRLSFVRNREPA